MSLSFVSDAGQQGQGTGGPMKTISAGGTDIGLRRKNNEDAYVTRPDLEFFAVADGIGGSAAGEVASRIFIGTAQEVFEEGYFADADLSALVQESFRLANERIQESMEANPEHRGMGCTAELVAFRGDRYIVGHVGDSRTYLLRDGNLRRITRDHSLVQDQLEQGLITEEEAKRHRLRNVVLRAVGIEQSVALDLIKGKSLPGDIFLLCSDGLTDMVEEDLIHEALISGRTVANMVMGLIESARAGGGNDNITVVLCKVL